MKKQTDFRTSVLFLHVLVWIVVFCVPFLTWVDSTISFSWQRYLHFCVTQLIFMAVFYIHYFILIRKFLFPKKTAAYILSGFLVICAASIILHFWHSTSLARPEFPSELFPPHMEELRPDMPNDFMPRKRPKPGIGIFVLRDGAMLLLISGLALAIRMTMQWFESEREKQLLETARTEAELKNLKNQLNPHFLFNTLNNIYSLTEFNPGKARYAIESLSRMLRHMLYENDQEKVPIEHEFEFIRSYIELMALRLPASVTLEVDIPENGNGLTIAPLLFINLIENAFKHGISAKGDSYIRIAIRFDDHKHVYCRVENSSHPYPDNRIGSGIGLENLRKRLDLLYPKRYRFVYGLNGNRYCSRLDITL